MREHAVVRTSLVANMSLMPSARPSSGRASPARRRASAAAAIARACSGVSSTKALSSRAFSMAARCASASSTEENSRLRRRSRASASVRDVSSLIRPDYRRKTRQRRARHAADRILRTSGPRRRPPAWAGAGPLQADRPWSRRGASLPARGNPLTTGGKNTPVLHRQGTLVVLALPPRPTAGHGQSPVPRGAPGDRDCPRALPDLIPPPSAPQRNALPSSARS